MMAMSTSESDLRVALRCVEELLEVGITETQLLQAADLLTASQYSDVVDERNIEHLCGYPLCDQKLVNVPKQKYHISTATNQVLDLTQRKKFCSLSCFKASNYFSSQLSTLPPKTRASKRVVQLLPSSDSSPCKPVTETAPSVSVQPDSPLVSVLCDSANSVAQPLHVSPKHSSSCQSQFTSHQSQSTAVDPTRCAPIEKFLPDKSEPSSKVGFSNKYIERISDSLDIWLGSADMSLDHGEVILHPPLHDECVTQVQRSLFLDHIHSTLKSIDARGLGVDVVKMASSFRLTNMCVAFRPPQWRIIVLLLIAVCHGEDLVKSDTLESTLKELKATRDNFNSLLTKAKQLSHFHAPY